MSKSEDLINFIENDLGCKLSKWQKEFCKKLADTPRSSRMFTTRKGQIVMLPETSDKESKRPACCGLRSRVAYVDEVHDTPNLSIEEITAISERKTKMSTQYNNYLENHRANVVKGLEWLQSNLPESAARVSTIDWQIRYNHDRSKDEPDEYAAYDAYFYGGNKSYSVVQNFNKAWLTHIHRNPHHWQHWVLINDDPNEGEIVMDMPYEYIIEMICDWWAFSWNKGDLYEIFKWYDEHKDYMKLSNGTRNIVETILGKMREKLDEIQNGGNKNDNQN